MARRVAAGLFVAILGLAGVARAGFPAGSGEASLILSRWHEALARTDSPYVRAVALWELGIRGESEALLRALSDEGGPLSGPALEFAAARLFEGGRYGEVIEWARASRASEFTEPSGLRYRVGQSYLLTGRRDEATSRLGQVTEGPLRPYALHSLALIAFADGRPEEAEADLRTALDAAAAVPDPDTRAALTDWLRLTLARMLYQTGTSGASPGSDSPGSRVALALEEFDRIGDGSPLRPEALRGRGWCELERDQWAEALAAFDVASSLDPGSRHEDLWAEGRVHLKLGQYLKAAELFAAAREAAEGSAASAEVTGPNPEVSAWSERLQGLGEPRDRVAAMEDRALSVGRALDSRAARLGAARELLAGHRERLESLGEELEALARQLPELLGETSEAELFRGAERGRVEVLFMRRDLLTVNVARLETAIAAVELGRGAGGDPGPPREQIETLWRRLRRVRSDLAEAWRELLEALDRRRTERLAHLTRTLRLLSGQVGTALELAGEADRALDDADRRTAQWRTRLGSVEARVDAVAETLTDLEDWTQAELQSVREEAARRRGDRLRLQSDRYALEEVQALDLARGALPAEEGGEP